MSTVRRPMYRSSTRAVIALGCLLLPAMAHADGVQAGFDLFQTDPGSTYVDFGANPLPPSFFDPGSDPFHSIIRLGGRPLGHSPLCPQDDLGNVDTMVRRLSDAQLPGLPSQDTVPIEILQLSLVSTNPIVVTYNGGTNPEFWDVRVELSPTVAQPQGTMTIRHLTTNGGTFDSQLPVLPIFIFVRQGDSAVRDLDFGAIPTPIQFIAADVPWVHTQPPATSCTANFCVNPGAVTVELGALAQHGVISICPDEPVATHPATWGGMKTLYHDTFR